MILTCDIGTSSCKVALFKTDGKLVDHASSSYSVITTNTQVEQDPNDWWHGFLNGLLALRERGRLAEGLSCVIVGGQMSALLGLDAQGSPVGNALIWADQRATNQAAEICSRLGIEQVFRTTGNPINSSYPAAKLLWLKEAHPEQFASVGVFIQPKDYITYKLSGRIASDFTDASCTGLFDLREQQWSPEIIEGLELPSSIFPTLIPSGHVLGHLTKNAALETGLAQGLPILMGAGDGPAASVGAGLFQTGQGYINFGTSAWLAFCLDKPLEDPERRTFTFSHVLPDLYTPTGSTQNAGSALEWIRHLFGATEQAYVTALKEVPPGSDGLVFLPYLWGERTPYWNSKARGAFIGARHHHSRLTHLRSTYEGISFQLRLIRDTFREQGIDAPNLRFLGGGSQSRDLTQLIADVLDQDLERYQGSGEATTLGLAITAAVGLGILPSFEAAQTWLPDTERFEARGSEVYDLGFERFKHAYQHLEAWFEHEY